MVGVWIAPVTAQLMMILSCFAAIPANPLPGSPDTPGPGQAGGSLAIFCRCAATRRRSFGLLLRGPFAESLAGLEAETAARDQVDEIGQRSRRHVEIGQHVLLDVEGQVGADEIGVLERPEDGEPSAEARP